MRLVQIPHIGGARRVGVVDGSKLTLVRSSSIYELLIAAIEAQCTLRSFTESQGRECDLDYDEVYDGE
jgi:hypothetical protein